MSFRRARAVLVTGLAALVLAGTIASTVAAEPGWRDPTEDRWVEVRSEHFRVVSNAKERRARELAIELERFRVALGHLTRGFELDHSVPTVMFGFRNDARLTPYKQDRDGRTMNVSGFFQPTPFKNFIALDASADAGSMRVVFHEYFHAVMDASLGDLPLWLGEGLAEYYSTFRTVRSSARVEVGHAIEDHLNYLALVDRIPWDDLFETTLQSPTYNEGTRQGAFYAQSWLLVHYLISTEELSKGLGRYLTALRNGADPEEAFEPSIGVTRATLTAGADAYRKQTRFAFRTWNEQGWGALDALDVRSMEPAAVFYELGDLLAHRGQRTAAVRHLERARETGRAAGDVDASMGVLALVSGDPDEARDHLQSAIDAGVRFAEPYVLLAGLMIDDAFAGGLTMGDATPPSIERARELLEEALGHEPENSDAAIVLARSYVVGPAVGRGLGVILQARSRRPLDLEAAEVHACLLARSGGAAPAWAVVRDELAPRDPERADLAADCVVLGLLDASERRLNAGDRDGASAILAAALEQIDDPERTGQILELKSMLDQGGTIVVGGSAGSIERFNEAVEKSKGEDLEGALAIFEDLAANAPEPVLRGEASKAADSLHEILAIRRWVDDYDRAIAAARAGRRTEAVEALQRLHATAPNRETAAAAQEALESLDAPLRPANSTD